MGRAHRPLENLSNSAIDGQEMGIILAAERTYSKTSLRILRLWGERLANLEEERIARGTRNKFQSDPDMTLSQEYLGYSIQRDSTDDLTKFADLTVTLADIESERIRRDIIAKLSTKH